jgi:hypothetical protein
METNEEIDEMKGTLVEVGLADAMRPLLRAAEGVLEEALEFEKDRKKARAARPPRGSVRKASQTAIAGSRRHP